MKIFLNQLWWILYYTENYYTSQEKMELLIIMNIDSTMRRHTCYNFDYWITNWGEKMHENLATNRNMFRNISSSMIICPNEN